MKCKYIGLVPIRHEECYVQVLVIYM